MTNHLDITARLILSIIFGGIIGMERESVNRPAGFRTHILVCIGSTLSMLVSAGIFEIYKDQTNLDPARIAAQVINGVGFLGAGTIIREGANVRGLTTAASLWTISAIGLAIGSGYYYAASVTTIFTYLTLISLSKLENRVIKKRFPQEITLTIKDKPGQIGIIGTTLGEMGVSIIDIKLENLDENNISMAFSLKPPFKHKVNDIILALSKLDGIIKCGISRQ